MKQQTTPTTCNRERLRRISMRQMYVSYKMIIIPIMRRRVSSYSQHFPHFPHFLHSILSKSIFHEGKIFYFIYLKIYLIQNRKEENISLPKRKLFYLFSLFFRSAVSIEFGVVTEYLWFFFVNRKIVL